MAELTEADKERVVILLAQFKRHAEVVEIMSSEYGIEIEGVQQVRTYDPTHPRFVAGEKWRSIFDAAREAYINDIKLIPAASQAWRLNELTDLYKKAAKAKNLKLAAELLEQIAREVGGVLTNERNLNVTDGRRAREMTSEDRAALLGSLLAEKMETQEQPEITKH